jgi:phosphomannomutase
MKQIAYIFDVDGTLTPPRGVMVPEFKELFLEFVKANPVYLITGSDKPKTFEQVGFEIYDACQAVYQCNGAEIWKGNKRIKSSDWKPSYEIKHFLENQVHHSRYPIKTSNHVEVRTGMINLSTVGRDCTKEQREEYYKWDQANKEREVFCKIIEKQFKDLQCSVGGQISIDIYPKGTNKSIIATDLHEEYELIFFGDKCHHGGNDYPLKMIIELGQYGKSFNVDNWMQTKELIESYRGKTNEQI